jgi:hypothetical protein
VFAEGVIAAPKVHPSHIGLPVDNRNRYPDNDGMTPQQLIAHYGTQVAAAEALGTRQSTVSDWCRKGWIPVARQILIETATRGELRANLADAAREYARG